MPEAKPGGWPETFLGMGWEMDKSMSLPWEEGVLCLLGEDGPLLCAQMDYFLVQGGGVSCLCRVRSHPPSSGTGRPILGRILSCLIVNRARYSFSSSPLCLLSSFLPRPPHPPYRLVSNSLCSPGWLGSPNLTASISQELGGRHEPLHPARGLLFLGLMGSCLCTAGAQLKDRVLSSGNPLKVVESPP